MTPEYEAWVERARAVRIEDELAQRGIRLSGNGKVGRSGACPICGGVDRFSINTAKQVWNCRKCGTGGDVIDLVKHLDGCGFITAVERLIAERPAPSYSPPSQRPAPNASNDNAGSALRIWDESVDLGGTLAAVYLASRSLFILEGVSGRVLRFHPRCPWRNDAGELVYVPALIGLYRDIRTDEPRAIWRRPLTADGRKAGKPKALGPKSGCAIKLTANEDVEHGLHVGEGPETMLAAMMLGFSPAWALGDASGVKTFPVLAGIDTLTIIVDRDANGVGQDAASTCFDRWREAGREVWTIVPNAVGADLNDVVAGSA